jgi:MFS family permease
VSGYFLFICCAIGFVLVCSVEGLVILFILFGLVYAIIDASERAFVSDLCSSDLRGTSLGVYYGAVGVSSILSSVIAGAIWTGFGPSAAFLFGAATAAVAAISLVAIDAGPENARDSISA